VLPSLRAGASLATRLPSAPPTRGGSDAPPARLGCEASHTHSCKPPRSVQALRAFRIDHYKGVRHGQSPSITNPPPATSANPAVAKVSKAIGRMPRVASRSSRLVAFARPRQTKNTVGF